MMAPVGLDASGAPAGREFAPLGVVIRSSSVVNRHKLVSILGVAVGVLWLAAMTYWFVNWIHRTFAGSR